MCYSSRRLSLQRYHPGVLASCSLSSTIDSPESPLTFWLSTGFEHFIFLLLSLLICVGRNSNVLQKSYLCMANQLTPNGLLYLFQSTVKHHRSPIALCHCFWWNTRAFDPHQDFWKEWLRTSANQSGEISWKLCKRAKNAYEGTLVLP